MRESRDAVRAWTLMDELVLEIHAVTGKLPRGAHDDLAGSLRACAVRGAVGLVRGLNGSEAELMETLRAMRGTLAELRYYLYLARRLGLIDLRRYRAAVTHLERVIRCIGDILAVGHDPGPDPAPRSARGGPASVAPAFPLAFTDTDLFGAGDG